MVAKSKSKIKAKAKLASNGSSEPSSTNDNNNIQDFLAPPPKRLGKTGKVLASELCDENDEENIVIDLADEEDEEEDGTESEKFGEPRLVGAGGATSGHYNTSFARSSLDSTTSERASLGHDDKAARSFTVGQLIWFDPNQLGYCIPGKVLEFYPELMVLSVEACSQPASEQETGDDEQRLQVYELSEPALLGLIKPRRPISSEQGLADLAELEEGSLEALIYNLRLRFKQDLIYTHCGRKLLISLNPHRQLGELYDMKQVGMYDTISGRLAAAKSHSADFLKLANDSDHEHLLHHLTSDSSKCQLVAKSSRFIRWLLLNVGADYGSAPLSGLEHQLANACSSSKATGGYDRPPAASSRQATGARAHLFRMADDALRAMLTTGLDQCFLLLGDSGAGKTETCKLLLQYLAAINKSPTNLMTELMLESIQMLESFGNAKTLLNSNSSRFGKIVEINFNLNTGFISDARLTDLNLLDRGRIVSQNEGERNFHIFYELLEGLSPGEKEKYGLQAAKKYFYLNQGHCVTIQQRPGQATPVKEDAEDFRALNAAMQVLGFNYEEQDTIFRILASILHLGNIYFHRKVLAVRSAKLNAPAGDDSAGTEGVEIGSDTELRWVSHLLQIQFEHVLRCLTVRTSETQASAQVADFIVTPLNIDQALDTRDAIARALYSCLFRWLVQRINVAISGAFQAHSSGEHLATSAARGLDGLELRNADEESKGEPKEEPIYWCRTSESLCEFQPDKLQQGGASGATKRARSAKEEASKAVIYILDSFGFENLTENQFEQLCINYSAELLHHHTQRYLLRLEQAEYARERLRWQPITSSSVLANIAELQPGVGGCSLATSAQEGTGAHRQSVVSLIAKRPLGLLALLDDECNFPKSSDQSFAEKCHHNHALNDNYQCARLASGAGQEFGVRHFGQQTRLVWYQVEGFVEKNRDSLRADVLELLYGSRMSLVVDMLHKMHLKQPPSQPQQGAHTDHHQQLGNASLSANGTLNSSSGKTLSRTYDGRYVVMKPRATTAAARFLDTLHHSRALESIGAAAPGADRSLEAGSSLRSGASLGLAAAPPNPWFIFCLNPNRARVPQVFDVPFVQEQARAFGLLQLVQQRKLGYPARMRYLEFLKRYRCLVTQKFLNNLQQHAHSTPSGAHSRPNQAADQVADSKHSLKQLKDTCCAIIEFQLHQKILPNHQDQLGKLKHIKSQYQCGLSKIFLNERLFNQLEQWRAAAYGRAIVRVQNTWRMWSERRHFLAARQAATCLQANWRCFSQRRKYLTILDGVILLQRRWRKLSEARRIRELELRRREAHQRRLEQMQQLQVEHSKQANQLRFRLHPSQIMRSQQGILLANSSTCSSSSSPSIYSSNNKRGLLDIPEDLAQLYRVQQLTKWTPVHTLANLAHVSLSEMLEREQARRAFSGSGDANGVPFLVKSDFCDRQDEVIPSDKLVRETDKAATATSHKWLREAQQLIDELDLDERYSLQKFLSAYFTPEVAQIGYSRLPITRPFTYAQMKGHKQQALAKFRSRRGKLLEAKQRLHEEQLIRQRFIGLEQKAIAIYKLILRFIDSDQSFADSDHEASLLELIRSQASDYDEQHCELLLQRLLKFKLISDYISYLCLTEPLLRDELYLQLVSQTWQNKRPKSLDNTWKLMLNCLSSFGPLSSRLARFVLKYASDFCSDNYKSSICLALFDALQRAGSLRDQLRAWPLPASERREQELISALANQRRAPTSLLEYCAQQVACAQIALSASFYVDDYTIYESLARDARASPASDDGEELAQRGARATINYSNKTLVCVGSHSRAEQVASKLLLERQVPEQNCFGWSLEIQHEGELAELSHRLRGDDLVLDHFARLELLPELVQLVDDDLEAFEAEQVNDELGLLSSLARAIEPEQQEEHQEAVVQAQEHCSACESDSHGDEGDAEAPRRLKASLQDERMVQQRRRFSKLSQFSWDTELSRAAETASNRCLSVANWDAGEPRTRRASGQFGQVSGEHAPMYQQRSRWSRNAHLNQAHDYESGYEQRGGRNRRSMSMQELQLASARYAGQLERFTPNHQRYSGEFTCDDPKCYAARVHNKQPACRARAQRMSSGSLRHLNELQQQHHLARHHHHQQPVYYSPSDRSSVAKTRDNYLALSEQQLRQRSKRSSTPSSVAGAGTRHSSSAYGSQSSRNIAGSSVSSSNARQGGSALAKQRPKREPAPSDRSMPDYATPQSDYEIIQGEARSHHEAAPQAAHSSCTQARGAGGAKALHYAISSAMSDTSEAPSLASHVRAVKAPQTNGDLDRYLDDLFNPMLDDCKDFDELSDIRSLANTSIGGATMDSNEEAFLRRMCDPQHLSRIIRGLESDDELEEQQLGGDDVQQSERDDRVAHEEQRAGELSPTFESLIKSLKAQQRQVAEELGDFECQQVVRRLVPSGEFDSLDLGQLRAINEQLESQIQAARSARNSVQISAPASKSAAQQEPPPPPPPPPPPNFLSPDDIYSRTKTIRIGKWRWPPPEKESAVLKEDRAQASSHVAAESVAASNEQQVATDEMAPVGRLKISNEMKVKLEQLTNSSASTSPPPPPPMVPQAPQACKTSAAASGSRAAKEGAEQTPRKLDNQRRNLLESQLLGPKAAESSEESEQVTGKVLAAKQQLAAAAGLALSALDSSPSSGSQASSRRQSSQLIAGAARQADLINDELGPRTLAAIQQRQAFYALPDSKQEAERAGAKDASQDNGKVGGREQVSPAGLAASSRGPAQFLSSLALVGADGERQQQASANVERDSEWIATALDRAPEAGSPIGRDKACQPTPQVAASDSRASLAKLGGRKQLGKGGAMASPSAKLECLVYTKVDWQARVRKEIFRPSESYDEPQVCQLIFAQLVADVFNPRHWTRLSAKERAALKSIMKEHSIGYAPGLPQVGQLDAIKRELVRLARSFGLYFTRPYEALNFACLSESHLLERLAGSGATSGAPSRINSDGSGHNDAASLSSAPRSRSDSLESACDESSGEPLAFRLARRLSAANNLATDWVDLVAVHHTGLRLVALANEGAGQHELEQATDASLLGAARHSGASWRSASRLFGAASQQQQQAAGSLHYKVLDTLKFRDMTDVALVGARVLLVSMRNGKKCWMLSSNQVSSARNLAASLSICLSVSSFLLTASRSLTCSLASSRARSFIVAAHANLAMNSLAAS